jgi:hypothetical protein
MRKNQVGLLLYSQTRLRANIIIKVINYNIITNVDNVTVYQSAYYTDGNGRWHNNNIRIIILLCTLKIYRVIITFIRVYLLIVYYFYNFLFIYILFDKTIHNRLKEKKVKQLYNTIYIYPYKTYLNSIISFIQTDNFTLC